MAGQPANIIDPGVRIGHVHLKVADLERSLGFEVPWVNVDQVGDTGSHPFAEKKIPVIDFHSLTVQTLPLLHTTKDQMTAIDLGQYEITHRMLAAYLALLDQSLETTLASGVKIETK